MTRSRYVGVQVEHVPAETDKAFLFVVDGEEVWVPKSQLEKEDAVQKGDRDKEVMVTAWFCDKEGIEYD